jgi:uncharacterized protein YjcR
MSEEQPHVPANFLNAPKCGARTRKGKPCCAPAMKNGRCRLHGGKSTGPPMGNQNALKHGMYSSIAIRQRRELQFLLKQFRGSLMKF